MYRYETHLHTSNVSGCSRADVREQLEFYKQLGYDGVFITNHFIDGNHLCRSIEKYEDKIEFFFSDYEEAVRLSAQIGIKAFCGLEMGYFGTDFLVFGLDKAWFLDHPEIYGMEKSRELPYLREHGALVIQAHPFREDSWIDHIRLFPRCVDGVETVNANRSDFDNSMAEHYAESYGLLKFAGSDNHAGNRQKRLAGMESDIPVVDEAHFIKLAKSGKLHIFRNDL